MRLQVPLGSGKCAIRRSKNALSFPEFSLYFPGVPLCFLEFPFRMPKVASILDNLKTSTWNMIFYVFYLNVSLHDSLDFLSI